jgi:hypothetical protein
MTPHDEATARAMVEGLDCIWSACSCDLCQKTRQGIVIAIAQVLKEQRTAIATAAESEAEALRHIGKYEKAEALFEFARRVRKGGEDA